MEGINSFISSLSYQEQLVFYAVIWIILLFIVFSIIKKLFKLAIFAALILAIAYFVLLYFGQDIAAKILKERAIETVEKIKEKAPEVIEEIKNSEHVKEIKEKVKETVKETIKNWVNQTIDNK